MHTHAHGRTRWLLTQRSLYDAVHHGGALMLQHYLLTWVPDDLDLPTLHTRIERCFLTEATPTRLPPVWLHHPLERLQSLYPNQPGDPYLAVLMGYDAQGTWNLLTWQALLQLDVPLTVAIDIHTPPKEGFRGTNRTVGDAEDALDHVATKQPHDRRARQARDDAGAANDQLSHQFVHHVGYAVLAEAPTERALHRATQTIDAAIGTHLKLHPCAGVQAEQLKLFTALPRRAMRAPLPTRPTLSEGVAHKTPFGIRRQARDQGLFWGTDLDTALLHHYDLGLDRKQNGALLVLGKPKYGKTTFLLTQSLRMAVDGTQIVLLEPADRARLLRDAIGSELACRYTDLHTTPTINILDPVSTSPAEQRDKIVRNLEIALGKLMTVGDRQTVQVRPLTQAERGAIDVAMRTPQLYGEHCHKLATMTAADAPLLHELVTVLRALPLDDDERMAARKLAGEIDAILLGTAAPIYDAPTTLSTRFDADVTLYSFNNADPGVLPLIYDHVFSHLNRYIRQPRQRPLVVPIDEVWYMLAIQTLAEWLAQGVKTWRNFRGALWLSDQNIDTFVSSSTSGSHWGAFVTDNTAIRLFFRIDGRGSDVLEQAYRGRLEPRHLQRIRTLGQGEYVGMFEDDVKYVHYDLLPLEALYLAQH